MKIALAQTNAVIGDIDRNTARILARTAEAAALGADAVAFPELAICGYPPRDLLLKPHFIARMQAGLQQIAEASRRITIFVGTAIPIPDNHGKHLLNVAAVCYDGTIVSTHAKTLLPTYDVYDEHRYFAAAASVSVTRLPNLPLPLGLCICEDLWNLNTLDTGPAYDRDPIAELAQAGAGVLINLSASPFWANKQQHRVQLFGEQARRYNVPVLYINQVGGQDELIFEGASAAFGADGRLIAQAKAFEEDLLLVDLEPSASSRVEPYPDEVDSIYDALVLGTRDYVNKCGFDAVVLGLSGGIDSSVTAAIAVDALGHDRVHGLAMPSRHSSTHSLEDAEQLAANLGIQLRTIPIESVHSSMEQALSGHFAGLAADATEENIQARIRGNLLMAFSNKFGWLLLTTGNKSELAVGYCTLYGDMCGGLAVLSDVPKTTVYRLAELINRRSASQPATGRRGGAKPSDPGAPGPIPQRVITKPPSAELRDNQTDQDSLPPYDELDAVLELYVEQERSADQIIAAGFASETVRSILNKVDRNEHKRIQAPVGLKVTSRAFGTGRRLPIAARLC